MSDQVGSRPEQGEIRCTHCRCFSICWPPAGWAVRGKNVWITQEFLTVFPGGVTVLLVHRVSKVVLGRRLG